MTNGHHSMYCVNRHEYIFITVFYTLLIYSSVTCVHSYCVIVFLVVTFPTNVMFVGSCSDHVSSLHTVAFLVNVLCVTTGSIRNEYASYYVWYKSSWLQICYSVSIRDDRVNSNDLASIMFCMVVMIAHTLWYLVHRDDWVIRNAQRHPYVFRIRDDRRHRDDCSIGIYCVFVWSHVFGMVDRFMTCGV